MKTYINAIGTAVPEHRIEQNQAAAWMIEALGLDGRQAKMLQTLYDASGIQTRYSVLPDYTLSKGQYSFYPNSKDLEPFPTISQRMEMYAGQALPLAVKAVEACLDKTDIPKKAVTHLIVVSCTGMYAPGLDIELIEQLGLDKTIERTAIQFMGCYAAFNALKTADYICRADANAQVLIVCIELCTLHFQKYGQRDHIVSNALFADGAAAILVQGKPGPGTSLSMENFHCDIESSGKADMAWRIANHGFEMTLSSYIPKAIKGGIKQLAERLLQRLNLQLGDVQYYAIHPGGRRILEVIEEELGLSPEDNCHAYEVLQQYGNMSSPTVVFVLESIMRQLGPQDKDKKMLSFAFGPGLTMESMLLNVNYA